MKYRVTFTINTLPGSEEVLNEAIMSQIDRIVGVVDTIKIWEIPSDEEDNRTAFTEEPF